MTDSGQTQAPEAVSRMEQIFLFFTTKALAVSWHIYDQLAIHLEPDIIDYIIARWPTIAAPSLRAGFILAMLASPRKRLAHDFKPGAEKLAQLGERDPHPYVRLVAKALSTWISRGFFDTHLIYSLPELQPSLAPLRKSPVNPSAPSAFGPSPPVFRFKSEHAIGSLESRLKAYSLDDETSAGRSITPPKAGAPLSAAANPLRKKPTPAPFLRRTSGLSAPAPPRRLNAGPFGQRGDSAGSLSLASPLTPSSGALPAGKGFKKETRIKMLDLDEVKDIDKSKTDAQKKLEDDAKAEKERKQREREAEMQARREVKEAELEEKRQKKARLEEERRSKLEAKERRALEREEKRKHMEDQPNTGSEKRRRKSDSAMSPDSAGSPLSPTAPPMHEEMGMPGSVPGGVFFPMQGLQPILDAAAALSGFQQQQQQQEPSTFFNPSATTSFLSYNGSMFQPQLIPQMAPQMAAFGHDAAPPTLDAHAQVPIQPALQPAPATSQVPVAVEEIIGGSDLVTQQDIKLIEDFLTGNYVRHDETKEVKLSERIYVDDNGQRKRENMWILLNYSECKWRKVKRTSKLPSA
ncbi:hypothetical protein HK105_208935 [Polyrhizophydium stewartii]|uniref:Uncharacterized protein n=1 Tax=Polyrhizophydium stewartii TaxID=2732419 RepID=A0ABR4MWJ7_9FUNG|nr:hypothetical protein HK105_006757 [Polyrhizophydium stewartii]